MAVQYIQVGVPPLAPLSLSASGSAFKVAVPTCAGVDFGSILYLPYNETNGSAPLKGYTLTSINLHCPVFEWGNQAGNMAIGHGATISLSGSSGLMLWLLKCCAGSTHLRVRKVKYQEYR